MTNWTFYTSFSLGINWVLGVSSLDAHESSNARLAIFNAKVEAGFALVSVCGVVSWSDGACWADLSLG